MFIWSFLIIASWSFPLKNLTKCKSDHDAVPDPMVAMHRCPCSAVWKALAAS